VTAEKRMDFLGKQAKRRTERTWNAHCRTLQKLVVISAPLQRVPVSASKRQSVSPRVESAKIEVLLNVIINQNMKTERNTARRPLKAPTAIIERLGQRTGILRPRDLARKGVPRIYLQRMVQRGLLVKHGRGLYGLPDAEVTEHHSLAQVGKRVPLGVICLLSALRYYGLTTQTPFEVWIALERGARSPRIDGPKLHVVRFSGAAMKTGIKVETIEGVSVRIYGVAKTVADCFKYRNKTGTDIAIEALREAWRGKRCTMDDLWSFAKVCRVANVMRPYQEMLT
jgi:hypothetical protein